MRKIIAVVGALALSGALSAYQYEISGYPPPSSSVTASAELMVETGRGGGSSVLQAVLEARFRTFWMVVKPFASSLLATSGHYARHPDERRGGGC